MKPHLDIHPAEEEPTEDPHGLKEALVVRLALHGVAGILEYHVVPINLHCRSRTSSGQRT